MKPSSEYVTHFDAETNTEKNIVQRKSKGSNSGCWGQNYAFCQLLPDLQRERVRVSECENRKERKRECV